MTEERLDQQCGTHFTYRALIEAGETWQRLRVANTPVQADTWEALRKLATDVLDPIWQRFGFGIITYGFASAALTRHIRARIDPSRDQHAGHELKPDGTPICSRFGQAVDFKIEGVPSTTIAVWIADRLPFDRLYFYGADKPIHVSVGPEETRAIVEMMAGPSGRRVPQRRDAAKFITRYSSSR